jgi:MFS family permease
MESTISGAPAPKKSALLINRNYTRLWAGQSLSAFGDMIFDTTLVVWVAVVTRGQPWSAQAISAVLIATALPNLLVGPLAGVFVDRWDKRRTMLWMDALRALLIATLGLATNVVPLPFLPQGRLPLMGQLGAIFTTVFLASTCAQFFNPSRLALIGDIVEPPDLPRASGLGQTTQSMATLLGPAIAPPLFLFAGVQWAIIANALSFVVSFVLLLSLRVPKSVPSAASGRSGRVLRDFGEGVGYLVRNRVLFTLVVSVAVIMFGAGMINALDILFALDRLHAPLDLYGLLATAMGAGMLGGSILASVFVRRVGLVRTLNLSLVVAGVLMLVYSRLTSFVPAVALMALVGVFQATLNVVVGPLLLRVTPHELVGRVANIIMPVTALAMLLSTALAGYLVSTLLQGFHSEAFGLTFEPIDTLFSAGAILVLLGGLFAIVRLGFRDPEQVSSSSIPARAGDTALVHTGVAVETVGQAPL